MTDKPDYDPADDSARSYDEAIRELRRRVERGERVKLFGREVGQSSLFSEDAA